MKELKHINMLVFKRNTGDVAVQLPGGCGCQNDGIGDVDNFINHILFNNCHQKNFDDDENVKPLRGAAHLLYATH